MISQTTRELIRQRLEDEVGRIAKEAPLRVALTYPSPYHVAMSSLGYQRIYALLQAMPGVACERVFLADGADQPGRQTELERPVSYESLRELGDFPLIAVSVAYELELAGLLKLLGAAGIPLRGAERGERHPLVLAGGPLTFSNPLPLTPFVDAIVIGEGEGIVEWAIETLRESGSRQQALESLSAHPHILVPAIHGEVMPKVAACDDALLPATSVIITPHTELSNMFLLEAERGCSRGCTY